MVVFLIDAVLIFLIIGSLTAGVLATLRFGLTVMGIAAAAAILAAVWLIDATVRFISSVMDNPITTWVLLGLLALVLGGIGIAMLRYHYPVQSRLARQAKDRAALEWEAEAIRRYSDD